MLVFALALILILAGGNGGGGGTPATRAEQSRDLGPTVSAKSRRHRSTGSGKLPQNVYVVKSGDTLAGIADKTGVPVSRLQDLNPGLDQFSLVAGQRIQLR